MPTLQSNCSACLNHSCLLFMQPGAHQKSCMTRQRVPFRRDAEEAMLAAAMRASLAESSASAAASQSLPAHGSASPVSTAGTRATPVSSGKHTLQSVPASDAGVPYDTDWGSVWVRRLSGKGPINLPTSTAQPQIADPGLNTDVQNTQQADVNALHAVPSQRSSAAPTDPTCASVAAEPSTGWVREVNALPSATVAPSQTASKSSASLRIAPAVSGTPSVKEDTAHVLRHPEDCRRGNAVQPSGAGNADAPACPESQPPGATPRPVGHPTTCSASTEVSTSSQHHTGSSPRYGALLSSQDLPDSLFGSFGSRSASHSDTTQPSLSALLWTGPHKPAQQGTSASEAQAQDHARAVKHSELLNFFMGPPVAATRHNSETDSTVEDGSTKVRPAAEVAGRQSRNAN